MPSRAHSTRRSIGWHLAAIVRRGRDPGRRLGMLGARTELAGAVIAAGSLVVESNVKKVQHPVGGTVGELFVKDGSKVAEGDILVQLDETIAKSNLATVTKSLWELSARRARLEAERDGAPEVAFPDELLAAASDPAHRSHRDRRAQAVRAAARGAARPEGAAAGARRAAQRGDHRPDRADRSQGRGNPAGAARARRRARSLGEEAGPDHAGHRAGARRGAAQGRARPAHRRDRPGQGQDFRARGADPADRSESAQRRRQGAGRHPRQVGRADRAKGRGSGSAAASSTSARRRTASCRTSRCMPAAASSARASRSC